MLPGKFRNVDPLKSLETFLVIFASSNSSRKATKLHEKGNFDRDFENWGATCPLYPPVPTSMLISPKVLRSGVS